MRLRSEAHRPTRQGLVALCVLGAHALWLASWQGLSRPSPPPTSPGQPPLQWVMLTPMPPQARLAPLTRSAAERPTASQRAPTWREAPATPAASHADATPRATHTATGPWALLPEPPASAPSAAARGRLWDSEATREAIRAASRGPLLSERVAEGSDAALTRTDRALSQALTRSLKPDCLAGQAGGGGGLLALPGLAFAAATGRCTH